MKDIPHRYYTHMDSVPYEYQYADHQVQPGQVYVHYKGGVYKVICLSQDEESSVPFVVYRNVKGQVFHRPLADWLEPVTVDDKTVARFVHRPDVVFPLGADRHWALSSM